MKHRWPVWIGWGSLLAIPMLLIVALVVMLLWNAVIPDLFKGPTLVYWQALVLLILLRILSLAWMPMRFGPGRYWKAWGTRGSQKDASPDSDSKEEYHEGWKKGRRWFNGKPHEEWDK